jgi:hypothetical protein
MMLLNFVAAPMRVFPIWFEPSQLCNKICVPAHDRPQQAGRISPSSVGIARRASVLNR